MNELDRQILAKRTGESASEKIRRLFGKDVSEDYARKMIAGMENYIRLKESQNPTRPRSDETVQYHRDGTREYTRDLDLSDDEAADPIAIMRKMGLDPLKWELIDCKIRKADWDITIKNAEFKPETVTNHSYSVAIKIKPITNSPLGIDAIIDIISAIQMPSVKPVRRNKISNGIYMLELPYMDMHIGELAWGKETGDADFDLKIATQLYRSTMDDLISKVTNANYEVSQILFPIGQDFYHFDNPKVQTTSGTQLDSDTRWQKMYQTGLELLIEAIEKLRQIAPVSALWVPGNHDEELSFTAVIALKHLYENIEDVQVDASPTRRKYVLWKNNLIGFAHGRDEGKRIKGIMQVEAPDKWAASYIREMHLGDIHHDKLIEESGIEFRWMGTIAAIDAWSSKMGYVSATRKAQAIIWSDYGMDAEFYSYIRKDIQRKCEGQE